MTENQIDEERGIAEIPAPRGPVDDRPPAVQACRCGHAKDAHEHFRAGNDCGICGAKVCRAFRAASQEPSTRK